MKKSRKTKKSRRRQRKTRKMQKGGTLALMLILFAFLASVNASVSDLEKTQTNGFVVPSCSGTANYCKIVPTIRFIVQQLKSKNKQIQNTSEQSSSVVNFGFHNSNYTFTGPSTNPILTRNITKKFNDVVAKRSELLLQDLKIGNPEVVFDSTSNSVSYCKPDYCISISVTPEIYGLLSQEFNKMLGSKGKKQISYISGINSYDLNNLDVNALTMDPKLTNANITTSTEVVIKDPKADANITTSTKAEGEPAESLGADSTSKNANNTTSTEVVIKDPKADANITTSTKAESLDAVANNTVANNTVAIKDPKADKEPTSDDSNMKSGIAAGYATINNQINNTIAAADPNANPVKSTSNSSSNKKTCKKQITVCLQK
jgi:hypothetical protein